MNALRNFVGTASILLLLACSEGQASTSGAEQEASSSQISSSIALTGRVTDAAEILSDSVEASLTAKLSQLEGDTGHQMVVATVQDLDGQDIATFTTNLANSWGIGRKDHDDGVVFLVAPNERKVRIAVGYGLESKLPDQLCQQILDEHVLPRFREGDLTGGTVAGVDALTSHLSS